MMTKSVSGTTTTTATATTATTYPPLDQPEF